MKTSKLFPGTVAGGKTASATVITDTLGAGQAYVGVTNIGSFVSPITITPLVHSFSLPSGTLAGSYSLSYRATVNASATSGTVNNAVSGVPCTTVGGCTTDHPVGKVAVLKKLPQRRRALVQAGDTRQARPGHHGPERERRRREARPRSARDHRSRRRGSRQDRRAAARQGRGQWQVLAAAAQWRHRLGTHGDRGNAAQVNAEYRLAPDHTVYGTFTASSDNSEYDSVFNPRQQGGWTVGQRWRLTDKANLFNESQYLRDPNSGKGLANTFGMDFYPAVGWNLGFTLQQGELTSDQGDVHRRAVSVTGGHTTPETTWSSKAEWRRDTGAEQRVQWVLANRIDHKVNESWRVSGKFNYSDTDDKINAQAQAKYTEAIAGFAWRPMDEARYALLGRFTHLYDLATLGQVNQVGSDYDQKSDVVSVEGIYKYDRQWEFVAKLARRSGSARFGRGTGQWFDSATTYMGFQTRYELPQKWHALLEYRLLDVKDGGNKRGWLAGIDRDITKNLRVGVGYNFTSFSDDLTKFGYKYKGFFLNVVGSY